jgi:hypothetical protein
MDALAAEGRADQMVLDDAIQVILSAINQHTPNHHSVAHLGAKLLFNICSGRVLARTRHMR